MTAWLIEDIQRETLCNVSLSLSESPVPPDVNFTGAHFKHVCLLFSGLQGVLSQPSCVKIQLLFSLSMNLQIIFSINCLTKSSYFVRPTVQQKYSIQYMICDSMI